MTYKHVFHYPAPCWHSSVSCLFLCFSYFFLCCLFTMLTFTRRGTLSRWPSYSHFLPCKYLFMIFNWILFLSSTPEILFSVLTLHIHPTILASLLSFLVTLSYLTHQVLLPCSITLHKQGEYNLSLAPKGKSLLCNKSKKFLHCSIHNLNPLKALLSAPSVGLLCVTKTNMSNI